MKTIDYSNEIVENKLKEIWLKKEKNIEVRRSDLEGLEDYMVEMGYITLDGDYVKLTEKGEKKARKIVRLYRLAERLLTDILGVEDVSQHACKFEHVISEEVEEALCTLLGHPRYCPHGEYIPPGKCCIANNSEVKRVIYRLDELSPGEYGKIKYLQMPPEYAKMILSTGIAPGTKVKVVRTYPNLIIEVENTYIAIDKNIATNIFIIKSE